ncbi:3-(3-hydroxy-phenyl)propionate hydroxylase [Sphingomonas vulcanisoli]|uniref:3-(3-hydroxy-phenyl)propionate hydroxylase n=1 Tax=Sphingomonas vulcanisoli TaxID=1658060 RepID=A0ABX0TSZ3_9SPHN|nr:FAD-dependent monooxygenase [Sphingomonas vulcanisoli]NIJ08571.1 3-(3-hydroxy-phenyl)propionate hydroxylase [Sphingomonas vulcanisoli]
MIKTRVLVAGGGPAGAVAAYRLALAGIDTVLVEALAYPPEDMRASTLHPPTLDMLEEIGVLDELESVGLRAPAYHYRNRQTDDVIAFDMGELSDISAHPYRLQCEQFKITRLLTAKLDALPAGRVLFQHRVVGYDQDADGVTAHVETPTAIEHIRADYLIAADGAGSIIRKWTGAKFEGFTYPERFLTLSTRYPVEQHFSGLASVNYVSDADEWCVLLRVPEFWRVLVPTENEVSDATLLSDANKDAVFDRLTGNGAAVETNHRTLYRVHQRVVDRFRHGRVLLAGDAAHLNNPLGGFGMNSGIHDVWNLTTKLRSILQEGAPADTLLDQYDRQRRTIAKSFVQTQTIENKKAMEARDADGASDAERRMAEIANDPERRRGYLLRQSMYESMAQEAEIA